MLDLTPEESREAEVILAEIESSLDRFLRKAHRMKFRGAEFSLTLAVKQARECVDAVRELRVTIFGASKKTIGG